MSGRAQAEFYCSRCGAETAHVIVYVRGNVGTITCGKCGYTVGLSREVRLMLFATEIVERTLRKPSKMGREFARAPTTFVLSLPRRMLSKPGRVIAELRDVWRAGH